MSSCHRAKNIYCLALQRFSDSWSKSSATYLSYNKHLGLNKRAKYYSIWAFIYLMYACVQYRFIISLQQIGTSLMVWVIDLKGFSSRSIIEIHLIDAFDYDDDDGDDDDILNSHNFLSHDRHRNRYRFVELNVLVKSFWNVVNHLNWVHFASRNLNCLCSLTLLLMKLIAID